jgi:hypothetical protein
MKQAAGLTPSAPLHFSGEFWGERIQKGEQENLIRALSRIAGSSPDVDALPAYVLGERKPLSMDSWQLPASKERVMFSSAWLSPLPGALEGDIDTPFVWRGGDGGILPAGVRTTELAEGLRFNGFRLADLFYEGAAAAAGFGTSDYLVLPTSRIPLQDTPVDIDTAAGKLTWIPGGVTCEPTAGRLFSVVRHDTWFLPCKGNPAVLMTSKGLLTRGQGFLRIGKWLAVYDDPEVLWPSRYATALGQETLDCAPFSEPAASEKAGKQAMRYLRTDQSPRQYERALSEIAGERILTADSELLKLVRNRSGYDYWLRNQGVMWLPGSPCYAVGNIVPADRGHRVRVRSYWTDGKFWEHPRWSQTGLSSSDLWPRLGNVRIPNQNLTAISSGSPLRTTILHTDPDMQGLITALDVNGELHTLLGLDLDSPVEVNLLDAILYQLRERVMAVETDLHMWAPERWHEVREWAERERPAGSTLIAGFLTELTFGNDPAVWDGSFYDFYGALYEMLP